MRYETFRPRFTNRSLCEALESRVLLSALPAFVATPPAVTHHAVKQADESSDSFWSDDSGWGSDSSSGSTSDSSDDGGSFWDSLNDPSDSATQPATGPATQPGAPPDDGPLPPDDTGSYDSGYIDTGSYDGGYGDGGFGEYGNISVVWFFPAPCRPATPYGLNAVPLNATTVRLTWRGDVFNTTGFNILRLGPGKAPPVVTCVPGSVTCFVDTHVAPGTTYTYAVCAINAAGNSGFSRPVNVTTPNVVRGGGVGGGGGGGIGGWTVASGRPAQGIVTGTPLRVGGQSVNRAPAGFIDRFDRNTIAGWAFDADAGAAPIQIRYSIDNQPARLALANTARSDLVAHVGSANHGFTIKLPKLTPAAHLVTVYAVDPASGKLALLARRWIAKV
jgi:hypothetical protein